ncbi:hypothetical protein BURCENBC7_AP0847 [Burkholderia cenocepacia BC7]|nr:hypothetical protein BURCENK562V_C7111 [Burkholderia cenocepacia K56-2Valvano]ERI28551.1 hypothetical protein BURCENBC7_AP0847 [Burkholderia cenocepacia BC7]
MREKHQHTARRRADQPSIAHIETAPPHKRRSRRRSVDAAQLPPAVAGSSKK